MGLGFRVSGTRRDNGDCLRVLLYSYSTTITGWRGMGCRVYTPPTGL